MNFEAQCRVRRADHSFFTSLWSARRTLLLLALFAIFVAPSFSQDTWTLVTADFQSRQITPIAIDDKGIKTTTDTIGWDKVLELDHLTPSANQAAGDFSIYL